MDRKVSRCGFKSGGVGFGSGQSVAKLCFDDGYGYGDV